VVGKLRAMPAQGESYLLRL